MKNPFKNTVFEFGVLNYKSMPDEDCVEVLLSGRSNAGKSSALNALARAFKALDFPAFDLPDNSTSTQSSSGMDL